jgi:outer membrane immunogenic protein
MRTRLLLALMVPALSAPLAANAADLSYKAFPTIPVNWAGVYVGAYGGISGANGANFGLQGELAGGTVGYNWQSGAVVFGIEGDGGWAGMYGGISCPLAPVIACVADDDWLATVRGRLGWTPTPNLLVYATTGAAFGNVRIATNNPAFTGVSEDRTGWSAGAGFEWMFLPFWGFKAEYLHYDLGTFVCGAGACAPSAVNLRYQVDTLKFGFNYHFF